MISRKQQAARAPIPYRVRVRPAQPLQQLPAVLLIAPEDHLRIAAASKSISERFERPAQLLEVIDLAVEDQRVARARIHHRLLVSRLDIEDPPPPAAHS